MADLELKMRNRTAVIGIVGLGCVGLPLAVAFSRAGFKVLGFDIQQERVDSVNRGMVLTNHPEIAEEVNVLRNHGCKTVLISPAETSETLLQGEVKPDFAARDFMQALQVLLVP